VLFDDEGNVDETFTPSEIAENRMSGAFPVFDTKIHTGKEATDKKTRNATAKAESGKSDRARYDGRPLMYDFEFRLWQQSLANAGITPSQTELEENAEVADYVVADKKGNVIRPRTAEERKEATQKRLDAIEARRKRLEARRRSGKHDPTPRRCPNMPPKDQAPTGDGLEGEEKKPLPQPLSEKQVVDLRRAVIEAYQEELKKTRGFTG
jgi:hypothetical protein